MLSQSETTRYQTDSEPITADGPQVIKLEQLLEILSTGQDRIEVALAELSEADLLAEVPVGERSMLLGSRLYGLYFHDTYQTGQTDLLRQIAGANDKIV